MEQVFLKIITFLYGIGGLMTIIGYFPTIKDLWKHKPSANMQTYLIWTVTTFFASLYGIFILKDIMFNVIVSSQLIICIIILILRLKIKSKVK